MSTDFSFLDNAHRPISLDDAGGRRQLTDQDLEENASLVIDDEAGSDDVGKTWSADKLVTDVVAQDTTSGPYRVIFLTDLPTADPMAAGQLWNDSGTLKVSAG